MVYVEIVLFCIGVAGLAIGYRRNRRGVLLAAAIVLFLSASVDSFVQGFSAGFRSGTAHAQAGAL